VYGMCFENKSKLPNAHKIHNMQQSHPFHIPSHTHTHTLDCWCIYFNFEMPLCIRLA